MNQDVQKRFTQRGVRGILTGLDDHTPGYLIFLPSSRQIVTSVDVIFDEKFIFALVHKNRAYHEAILTRPINDPIANYNHVRDKTGDITNTF